MAAHERDARVPVRAGSVLPFQYHPLPQRRRHPALSLVGAALGSLAVASVVSGLVSGPLSDRYGRKPLMLVSLSGSAAAFFAFSLADGFAVYLAISVAAGLVGPSMFDAARNAMVADVTQPGRRGRAYGLSPVAAGALLEARMPDAIWKIQLAAAALAAAGLIVVRALGGRRGVKS